MLVHPGRDWMYETLQTNFYWKGMKNDVVKFCKNCHICQKAKKTNKLKYGLLSEKEGEVTKWSRVNVDLWGPKKVKNKNGYTYNVHVMTMVDPVTGWFECCQLYGNPSSYRCQQILDTVWLARYPRPKEIGMDNGGEFQKTFLQLCENMNLKPNRSNPWNPQSNAILERIHQVLGDGMRTFDLENADIDKDKNDPFHEYLANVSYAIRSVYRQTHGYSSAQMVFGRDMFLDTKVDINWDEIKQRKQEWIRKSNTRENEKRIDHTYS